MIDYLTFNDNFRMEQDRLVKRTLIALTKGGTVYRESSLFIDVENRIFKQLELLAKQKGHWSEQVDGLTH